MAVVIDLTKQDTATTFYGSSQEDISYATNFWQSVQLHPPMESRLVSSDIKQRLKVAPASSQARNVMSSKQQLQETPVLQDFLSRARTMEHLEEYTRMQKFAEAKAEDKSLLVKHREVRRKKEELSRNKGVKPVHTVEERMPRDDYEVDEEDDAGALQQLDEFENQLLGSGNNSDSD
ncbi:cilia- and flagella-associated protein HOATZ-like [Mya arenaria]|uniref:cilia- and flagella-associated protein HOATZ-like n=1 Tax=Mya arenaria TaxID=6604 RepID=UPI0022E8F246|nr:cilia- and flagella-associated protein HOATZ-like [Mya arenaria]